MEVTRDHIKILVDIKIFSKYCEKFPFEGLMIQGFEKCWRILFIEVGTRRGKFLGGGIFCEFGSKHTRIFFLVYMKIFN